MLDAGMTCLSILLPLVPVGFGGQPTVVEQTGGHIPTKAEVASPCHKERGHSRQLR